ncbi:hypothetical protein DCAR_0832587 [Daucus carota subsp. sativus]|uniref:Uncharacterized protein n=1 Tax=Daucus carota subsp. sativus TaxID=79200 RepID=A0A175YR44_DAUCS|nr:PREDICTED: uncharacterized protein LOC108199822 isoform X1 [Daucus carota subsp. sativus]XP_017223301.1 PREDICTED: uncharacterized protein LOC108199822 isoform X1 [Daucus carota subsp. sativus]WOH13078.1 hypothetical protein DCAR_0832587 [Daucus carota subsp. sativus]
MRDHLRTPQQPHKLAKRNLKWSFEQYRSPRKFVEQCNDAVIAPGPDDVSINSVKDSDDFQVDESSVENSMSSPSTAVPPSVASADLYLSPLSSALTSDGSPILSDLSPLCSALTVNASPVSSKCSQMSSTITSDKVHTEDVRVNCQTADLSEYVKRDSGKIELFGKKLRQVRTQRMNSDNMILLSKSVLDELLKIAIEDLHNLPEKRGWFSEIVEKKVMNVLRKLFVVTLTFMLLIIFVGVFIFSSDKRSSYNELVPT